jgi:hypothetical protein
MRFLNRYRCAAADIHYINNGSSAKTAANNRYQLERR